MTQGTHTLIPPRHSEGPVTYNVLPPPSPAMPAMPDQRDEIETLHDQVAAMDLRIEYLANLISTTQGQVKAIKEPTVFFTPPPTAALATVAAPAVTVENKIPIHANLYRIAYFVAFAELARFLLQLFEHIK